LLYHVTAQPVLGEMARFWTVLNDGTVARQEPDGQEITSSMKRAVIANDIVEWYETCYCSPPLKHEKTTVYDRFFAGMKTRPVESVPQLKGQKFWHFLEAQQKAGSSKHRSETV